MHPALKRILVNGLVTAGFLGLIGYGYAELAGMWVAGGTGTRPRADDVPVADALRTRVPLLMAAWGFAFVAAGEGLLYRFRRPAKPRELKPDTAEVLLEDILRQVEAGRGHSSVIGHSSSVIGQEVDGTPPAAPEPAPFVS